MSGCESEHQQWELPEAVSPFLSLPHLSLSLPVPIPLPLLPSHLPLPSWHPSQVAKSPSYPLETSKSTYQSAPTPSSIRLLPSRPLSTSNALLYAHVFFEFMVLPTFLHSPPPQALSAVLQKS